MAKKPAPLKHPKPTKAKLDAYMDKLIAIINQHGWAVQTVMTNPPVAYTVGLTLKHNLPEFVVTGLPFETAQDILNELARNVIAKKFEPVEDKDFDQVFSGFNARFRKVSAIEASELKIAALFTKDEAPVDAWQLIWPDPEGRFPDDGAVTQQYANMQNLALIFSEQAQPDAH